MIAPSVNVREVLHERSSFGLEETKLLTQAVSARQFPETRQEIDAVIIEAQDAARPKEEQLVKAGIGAYLMGRHQVADNFLKHVTSHAAGLFHHGLALQALGRYADSEEKFESAAQHGYDAVECALRRVGAIRQQDRLDDAEKLLRSVSKQAVSRAEYSYQMGGILWDRGDTFGAVEYFERAIDMDSHHTRALFSLANIYAQYGNDVEAIALYERSLSKPPMFLNALLNLGLLYEDRENYAAAAFCFRRAIEVDPTNERARLYYKDIEAAQDMFFDEEAARLDNQMQALLARPISDFELSVRSRNCLENLGLQTLGDLTRVTEQDLLKGRNFGETSLKEVRILLETYGLRVGQNLHPAAGRDALELPTDLPPEAEAAIQRPIADLNLSVRARKCMARLNINTIGELMRRSPDDLLGVRNFGVTSLNEIRQRLTEFGLQLRND
ncbi:MAG TPA: DNA-directed RNA polymerase subunit alpha C-terminal domain-containing protein [Planctomycetaceae bacterium]|nr:DNA-directed RNA polymerase subunit alpha C-terminal domain-containing protein [Planctomycetaceae bacterium]